MEQNRQVLNELFDGRFFFPNNVASYVKSGPNELKAPEKRGYLVQNSEFLLDLKHEMKYDEKRVPHLFIERGLDQTIVFVLV